MDRDNVKISQPQVTVGTATRQRRVKSPTRDYISASMQPLTEQERRDFQGWVDLESDPVLFNCMLRQYGVQNVKIQEVLGLEDEMLTFLPKPVYGLIFLLRYRDDDLGQGEELAADSEHVWFANQVSPNLCATAALLNIVMNCPDINLGFKLQDFKDSTQGYSPAQRGSMLSQHGWIRETHNSFARRMDFLNADLSLSNDVTAWNKLKRNSWKTYAKRKKLHNDDETAFHFIAFVPKDGRVWRLDGLNNQPVDIGGNGTGDWMALARANIYERIAQYAEDGVQYNLLSLCQNPLQSIAKDLARKMKLAIEIEAKLSAALPDWRLSIESNGPSPMEEAADSCMTKQLLETAQLSEMTRLQLIDAASDPGKLIDLYRDCMADQSTLEVTYIEEITLINQEDAQAARRRHDLTPLIYKSIKTLADNGILRDVVAVVAGGA